MDRMKNFPRKYQRRQHGAVAIEFVFIFPVFFAIVYAIACYSLAFLMVQTFTHASEDALRAAIAVECPGGCAEEDLQATVLLQAQNSLAWLSPTQIAEATSGENFFTCDADMLCTVSLSAAPIIDGINLPGFGKLPNLPNTLSGRASLRL
ncbi:TadE/TadG family type IV pilus assembly protein [Zhongshania sp.]|jgi:hypothetical protein|uniref:TadE/TadG family type IV pilus assembly protein n=1 Tax=Zhongshania sp. TaxID=1971902 RepID=UPI0035691D99